MSNFYEPSNLVEHAADAGIEAIKEHLARSGAKIERLLIVLDAGDVPPGELECVTAGSGIEDAKELVAMLTGHFVASAKQIGLDVHLVPIGTRIGQG